MRCGQRAARCEYIFSSFHACALSEILENKVSSKKDSTFFMVIHLTGLKAKIVFRVSLFPSLYLPFLDFPPSPGGAMIQFAKRLSVFLPSCLRSSLSFFLYPPLLDNAPEILSPSVKVDRRKKRKMPSFSRE